MYRAPLQTSIDGPRIGIDPIRVGRTLTGDRGPDAYVTVERDDIPYARIDAIGENRFASG